jgi:hypothetical protein
MLTRTYLLDRLKHVKGWKKMEKPISATELRARIYRILDQIIETNQPQEILRNGKKLLIIPSEVRRLRLEELPKREAINCSVDELVETSWEQEWSPDS